MSTALNYTMLSMITDPQVKQIMQLTIEKMDEKIRQLFYQDEK